MNKHGGEQQFLPEQVDEQIEHLERPTAQPQTASQFIQDLRSAALDHDELFDRVWDRLVEHMEQTQTPSIAVQPHQVKRRSSMPQLQPAAQPPKQRRHIMSWVTLVAAIILGVLVTGSSIVVFQYAARSQQPHNSNVAGAVKATATQKPLPTQPPLPAALCGAKVDAGWEAVCKANQETVIDQVRQLNGYNLHVYAAYADSNRIILAYSVPASIMNTKQPQLPTVNLGVQAGAHLSPLANQSSYSDTATKQIYTISSTPLLSVADNISTLHVHADISIFMVKGKVSLDLSLPYHRGRVVNINQTQTVNGQQITLDHVSISASRTVIYLRTPQSMSSQGDISGYELSVDNWKTRIVSTSGGTWHQNDDKRSENLGVKFNLDSSLLNKTGEWSLLIHHEVIPGATSDVVFHFKV